MSPQDWYGKIHKEKCLYLVDAQRSRIVYNPASQGCLRAMDVLVAYGLEHAGRNDIRTG